MRITLNSLSALIAALCCSGLSHAGTLVTTVRISNPGSAVQTEVPYTFGQVFRPGDIKSGQSVSAVLASGATVPAQVEIKAKHPDGSARHAVITVWLDNMAAKEEKAIRLEAAAAPAAGDAIPLASLLATDFDAKATLTIGGTAYEASARQLLGQGTPTVWLSGPLCTEWLVSGAFKTSAGAAHPHLHARFAIRAYKGLKSVRVDLSVENDWVYEPGPQGYTYDAAFTVGKTTVFAKTGLQHTARGRWRRLGWYGTEPALEIRQERDYLLTTGAFPFYDPAIKVPESALADMASDYPPMTNGSLELDMEDTGAQPGIGPSPKWTARFLLTMDPRARANMLANGNCGGTYSIHWRDKKTDLPVSIDDFPYVSALGNPEDTQNPKTGKEEIVPNVTNGLGNFHADDAHQPSIAFVPYLLTGDYFYLEELQFWADWNMARLNPEYRGYGKGLVNRMQPRAQAWDMRSLGQAAYATPDAHPMKAYFEEKLKNNIDWYTSHYIGGSEANNLGYLQNNDYAPFGIAPWQDDFFSWTIGHIYELGYVSIRNFQLFKAKFVVGRMSDPGYCWLHASAYSLQIGTADKSHVYQTWAELYAANYPNAKACTGVVMDGYPDGATGYPSNMQPALAAAVDAGAPGAAEAWTKFMTRDPKPADYPESPQFAVVPKSQLGISGIAPGRKRPKAGSGFRMVPPGGSFRYVLGKPSHVYLDVYDVAGARQERIDAGVQGAGGHAWNPAAARGAFGGLALVRMDAQAVAAR